MRWMILVMTAGWGCGGSPDCAGSGGNVEIVCEADGCVCGSGPNEGEACEEDACETFCLACEDTGPLVLP